MITTLGRQLSGTMLGLLLASSAAAQTFCPGSTYLATSCTDGVCRTDAGENALNCPEDCADKSTQILSYYAQQTTCPPTTIHEPETVSELQESIRTIVSSGRKVKPTGTSHSATDLICADSNGDIVRSKHLRNIGPVESFEGYPMTVEIESGVTFQQLQKHLAERGLSHGIATPGYGGISLGGAIATGAHGSSLKSSATISSYVVALDVAGPDGKLTTYSEGTTGKNDPVLWQALKTNLGLLGFVARIRLKVEPQANMRVELLYVDEDTFVNTPNGVANAVADCDYVFLNWWPGQDKVQYLCGNRTTDAVDSPFAQNRLFAPTLSDFEQNSALTGLQLAMCDDSLKCLIETQRVQKYETSPPLVITTDASLEAEVVSQHNSLVGPMHRMISLPEEVLLRDAAKFSQLEYEGGMPMSEIQDAVKYINSVYEREGTCQPLIGTIMRFDVADDGLLASANHARPGIAAGEKMVHLEFVEFIGFGLEPDGYEKWVNTPYREIITHLVKNYNFWPHWGKNDEWLFSEPAIQARRSEQVKAFNNQIAKLDPYGVFSTATSRRYGFESPKEGQGFAETYYGNCASEDNDGDGLNNCVDRLPDDFSGMYARIDDDGVISGTCNVADSWNEMKSNFGADQQQHLSAGWDYESKNHSYHSSAYNWAPEWPKKGGRSWEVMLSGEFTADASGRYCFSQDNGSTGSTIGSGWNACGQVWVDKSIVAEVGYNSARKPQGCVDLVKGQSVRLDIFNRHHNANLSRSYISHPKWCFGGTEDCTPNRKLNQNELRSLETL